MSDIEGVDDADGPDDIESPDGPGAPETSGADPDVLARLGYGAPPEILEAVMPAAARGRHVALLADEGSGKELLYAAVARERCDPASPELQALVLCPTREAAFRAARAAQAVGRDIGLEALVLPDEEAGDGGSELPVAHLLAARPTPLLRALRDGRLSAAHLRVVAVDGREALEEADEWEATRILLDTVEDAQKILAALRVDDDLRTLLERRFPRARRWPEELFPAAAGSLEGAAGPPAAGGPPVHWAAAGTEEERMALLARGIRKLARETETDRAGVLGRDEAAAHQTADALAAEGFHLSEGPGDPGVELAWGEDVEPPEEVAAILGLPAGLPAFRRWLEPGRARLAVVESRHAAQLQLLARRAGWGLVPLAVPFPEAEARAVERFRRRVREEAARGELGPELLLLEPVLEELGPHRVAAALARLLRGAPGAGEVGEAGPAKAAAPGPAPGGRAAAGRRARGGEEEPRLPDRALRPAWTRIYLNVGKRDGAGPGDVVGAITGETDAAGAQIGKIDIRATHTLVEIDSQIVDRVLEELQGARIKGREVEPRLDRKA